MQNQDNISNTFEGVVFETSKETRQHPRVLILGIVFGMLCTAVISHIISKIITKDERWLFTYIQDKPYLLYTLSQFDLEKGDDYHTSDIKGKAHLEIVLTTGSDINSNLQKNNFDTQEAKIIINLLREALDFRTLKAGQKIFIEYDFVKRLVPIQASVANDLLPPMYETIEDRSIRTIRIKDINSNKITIQKNPKTLEYNISTEKPIIQTKIRVIHGNITTNLFTDILSHNVKYQSLDTILNEYAFSIDFQRDIHRGDRFIIVLNTTMDNDGDIKKEHVLYANLILNKTKHEIFAFEKEFFNRKGESVKKGLLRSPVDGARISSGFSKARMHPILGYSRAHLGVDFAVPYNTPIYAAGDGVVTYVGWKNGLGNTVTIKHNGTFTTNYGHASKFANIKAGQTVKQRQVIAYVGTTGLATGPHLHFEVLQNGVHINPRNVKMTSIRKINNKELAKFAEYVDMIDKTIQANK